MKTRRQQQRARLGMPYDPSLDFNGEWASLDQPEARIIAGNIGSKDENTAFALAVQGKLSPAQMDSYGITPSGINIPSSLVNPANAPASSTTPLAATVIPPWAWWVGGGLIAWWFIAGRGN